LTDVENSTFLWESAPEAMAAAIRRHYQLLDAAITLHAGVRPQQQGEGDSTVGAFGCASDALAAALDIQRAFAAERWPPGLSLRLRIALHTAQAQLRDEVHYVGPAINRCARLRALAHAGAVHEGAILYDLIRPYEGRWTWTGRDAVAPMGPIAYHLGMLAASLSRFDAAARHFEVAIRAAEQVGARPYLALAQGAYGAMLARCGATSDDQRAQQLLADAFNTARELGMNQLYDEVVAACTEVGSEQPVRGPWSIP
jgi:hypothetical protein